MQVFLRLLMFSVLLVTGASIQCEVCLGVQSRISNDTSINSITCTGESITCAPNKDTCMTAVAEHNLDGQTEYIIDKSCAYSEACKTDHVHLFLGKGKMYRSFVTCCKGHDCPKRPITLLTENTAPNGKECPACFGLSDTCKSETVSCTGDNTHCIAVKSLRKMTSDGNFEDNIIKGCTTKSLCASLQEDKIPLLMGEVENVVCTPEISRGSQPTSFLLLTFSGLLLMKIFE